MLLSSTTGLVILALVLIAGWLFGLASSSGGRKWKERYLAERDAHMANRKIADDKVLVAERRTAELEREHDAHRTAADARVAEAERRHAELERERTDLERDRSERTTTPASAPGFTIRPRDPTPLAAARPAYPVGERTVDDRPAGERPIVERRGWFDWARGPERR